MPPTPSTSEEPPEVSGVEYHKTIFKGTLFNLLADATRENQLTLLEINQVLQEVCGVVADDLTEVLSKHYSSRQ